MADMSNRLVTVVDNNYVILFDNVIWPDADDAPVSVSVTDVKPVTSPLVSGVMTSLDGGVTSLLVTAVPPGLNNISTLNSYFSKFGLIVNVQVSDSDWLIVNVELVLLRCVSVGTHSVS